jgi:hypothetical protein
MEQTWDCVWFVPRCLGWGTAVDGRIQHVYQEGIMRWHNNVEDSTDGVKPCRIETWCFALEIEPYYITMCGKNATIQIILWKSLG